MSVLDQLLDRIGSSGHLLHGHAVAHDVQQESIEGSANRSDDPKSYRNAFESSKKISTRNTQTSSPLYHENGRLEDKTTDTARAGQVVFDRTGRAPLGCVSWRQVRRSPLF